MRPYSYPQNPGFITHAASSKSIEAKVKAAKYPVVLTGAGISAPSGIPTFEDATWHGEPVRSFLTREFFEMHPIEFWKLFAHMTSWLDAKPNRAHYKLASWGLPVITQNIDGLHQKACSINVLELHGTLRHVTCPLCGRDIDSREIARRINDKWDKRGVTDDDRLRDVICEYCNTLLDTNIVLYGDQVDRLHTAERWVDQCDLLLVIGTSLQVQPAASLPERAYMSGAEVILINEDCVGKLCGD